MSPSTSAGRPVIRRRVGTAVSFTAAMFAGLTRLPALERFTNRRPDDPAIALVDAWAEVLDVLAFYSERLANERYLRTAIDPRSLAELAHDVGYTPGRGRAAAVMLAFALEDSAGAPSLVPIPRGTKVSSLPGPGQVPQNYETIADLDARPEWNAIRALSRHPQELAVGATKAFVDGLRGDLSVGDAILLVGSEREASEAGQAWAFRLLTDVEMVPDLNATRLAWTDPLGSPPAGSGRVGDEQVPDPRGARLYVLRRKAGIFGAAAPDYRLIGSSVTAWTSSPAASADAPSASIPSGDWPGWTVRAPGEPENTVDTDGVYPEATKDSWVVLTRSSVTSCHRVLDAREVSRTDYTLNGKVSQLSMDGPAVSNQFSSYVRETSAYVGSELLLLATAPVTLPVQGQLIRLDRPVATLAAGRPVVIRGPRPVIRVAEGVDTLVLVTPGQADVVLYPGDELEVLGAAPAGSNGEVLWSTTRGAVTAGPSAVEMLTSQADAPVLSEMAVVASPTPDQSEVGELHLAGHLTGCYNPAAVRILANVTTATHGESNTEVLGSGDATRTYQRFALAQAPLTYLAAPSGGAVVSTLEVRVDGRLWTEVPRLFGTGPQDEIYTTDIDDDGVVTVCFGDGVTGARLPTGINNVTATYRVGSGLTGRVDADQLTLLMSRPLGVRSVTNPLAAGLAADPEPPKDVRENAARTALTLGRVVSLRDVQDFARVVPGIGKAHARWLWDGRRQVVHLTVAGVGAQVIDGQALDDLETALLSAADARLPLIVQAAEIVHVYVTAQFVVDPACESAGVRAAATEAVTAALNAEARGLGQPLTSGDVLLAAHRVPGVVAVNVTLPVADVPSFQARMEGSVVKPAQLVTLAPDGLTLTEATP